MTYTFGAVLPTGVGAILALIGALLYLYVRTGIIFIAIKTILLILPNKDNKNEYKRKATKKPLTKYSTCLFTEIKYIINCYEYL